MANFEDVILYLEEWKLLDVLLPFILIFTLVFAVLQKTKILGMDAEKHPKKNFNVIVAFVMAMATIIPHVTGAYPPNADVVNIINGALPNISVIVVAIIMLLLIVGVWGKEMDISKSNLGGWVVLVSIVLVIFIFGSQAGWFGLPGWLDFLNDGATQATIITILVFGIIIWFVTKDDKKKDDKDKSFISSFRDVLKGDKE